MTAATTSVKKISIARQFVYAFFAVIAAILLPKLCHNLGAALGVGSSVGEMLLPMHLPVFVAGAVAGPIAGAAAGAISPFVSFAITQMPSAAMLVFMAIELSVYGLCMGIMRPVKMPSVLKVLAAQISGRLVRAAAILLAFRLFDSPVAPTVILTSIVNGAAGIILQLLIVPTVISFSERRNEKRHPKS